MSEHETIENPSDLESYVERIERLEEEKANYAEDAKNVKAEAKAMGFETDIINAILKIRAKPAGDHEEFNSMLDVYLAALNMQTPDRIGDIGELEEGSSELSGFIERLENIAEQSKEVADQVKDVKAEAKATGFDPKILNAVLKIRKKGESESTEFEMKVETYLAAVGKR